MCNFRNTYKWEQVKAESMKRDKCRCCITGEWVGLESHHLFCASEYPDMVYNVDNLVTLSKKMHRRYHKWNGGCQKECTLENFIQWLDTLIYSDYGYNAMELKHKLINRFEDRLQIG